MEVRLTKAQAPLRLAVIGLGRIMRDDHLPAIFASSEVVLESACDPDPGAHEQLPPDREIRSYESVDDLLRENPPEAAIIAIPHDQYLPVITKLAQAGVHILKEKPLATSLSEAKAIDEVISASGVRMMVTLQRRFNPLFRSYEQLRQHIGRAFYFDFRYTLSVSQLGLGWRSHRSSAGGGCLIDMGYHTVDLLIWYFGLPSSLHAITLGGSRENQAYDVEDTASLSMTYDGDDGAPGISGHVFLSRAFPTRQEVLTVAGTRGLIELDRFRIRRVSQSGEIAEELTRSGEWPSAYLDQLNSFTRWVRGTHDAPRPLYRYHFQHVALIEAAYLSAKDRSSVSPKALLQDAGLVFDGE